MDLKSFIRSLIALFAVLFLTMPLHAQFNQGNNVNQALIRLVEPGQLADTVNVWGDVVQTGRYLVPRDITIVQLLSYAGGPGGLRQNINNNNSIFSKTRVKISISKYDTKTKREVAKHFTFKYSDRVPEEFRTYDLSNEEVISVQVERKPTFLDYIGVIGPILGTITTSFFIYDQIIR